MPSATAVAISSGSMNLKGSAEGVLGEGGGGGIVPTGRIGDGGGDPAGVEDGDVGGVS